MLKRIKGQEVVKMSNDQFDFEDQFEKRLLAFIVSDFDFYKRVSFAIRFDHFKNQYCRDICEQAQEYVEKYGTTIPKDILRNEIEKMFYERQRKDCTLDEYWDFIDSLFSMELTGEQYTEYEVLRFAQCQQMKKALGDAIDRVTNREDLSPILTDVTKALSIGSKTISWESLPTVTDLKPSTTTWLVDEIIPVKAITIFHGSGGLGKSHIAWYLGNCVAEGKEFLGHSVILCPVYYIDYENPSAVEVGDHNDPGFKMKFGDNRMKVYPSDLLPPKLDSKQ
jgi:AAA domain